jgi:hypothetical protein
MKSETQSGELLRILLLEIDSEDKSCKSNVPVWLFFQFIELCDFELKKTLFWVHDVLVLH